MTQRNGAVARWVSVWLAFVLAGVSLVAYVVRVDAVAVAAAERTQDHEMRLRAVEKAFIEMQGDVKAIRLLIEQQKKGDNQ